MLRSRLGCGVAWMEQVYLRRIVLREHDVPCGINVGLIDKIARYTLDCRGVVIRFAFATSVRGAHCG